MNQTFRQIQKYLQNLLIQMFLRNQMNQKCRYYQKNLNLHMLNQMNQMFLLIQMYQKNLMYLHCLLNQTFLQNQMFLLIQNYQNLHMLNQMNQTFLLIQNLHKTHQKIRIIRKIQNLHMLNQMFQMFQMSLMFLHYLLIQMFPKNLLYRMIQNLHK